MSQRKYNIFFNNDRDFEIQKALLILEDIKTIKFPVANNLKKIQMERMKNPFSKADVFYFFPKLLYFLIFLKRILLDSQEI